jgi:PST family polysaccharide transporter
MAAVFPLVVFFALESHNLVLVVLGEKWLPVAKVFLLLSPAALIGASYVATGWVYVSLGRADRQLRWGVFASCVTVMGFLVTFRWGIEAVAASFSIVTVLLRYPSVVYCFRGTPVRVSDLTQVVWRPAASSAAAALAVIGFRAAGLPEGHLVELLAGGLIFVSAYAAAWLVLRGGRAAAAEFIADASHLRPSRGRGTGNGLEE